MYAITSLKLQCCAIRKLLYLLEELANRPRLKLLPRSVKDPVLDVADKTQQMSIFGGAKPRDETKYQQKVYEKEAIEKLGEDHEEEKAAETE